MNPQRDPFAELPLEERSERQAGRRPNGRDEVSTLALFVVVTLAFVGCVLLSMIPVLIAKSTTPASFVVSLILLPVASLFFIPAIQLAADVINAVLRMGRRG